ncbi:hypothetical protein MTR67_014028 [Solanum verrucosum]|uniref:Pre-mRNA-splicing factor Syf1/CRNKL1-like C-terminal HAT-repeats domain-containing protein n=1 Tax=Solanum verrucosum TaxID=315347 RepID=A0AAF0QDN4_SOLVR|nr:hypothetical protein MTR67_014028 [Solanum verrucosum]
MKNGEIGRARNCYERAVDKLADDDEEAEQLFVAFAEFEEKCRETDRARFIYKFALDHIPKGRAEDLYSKFVAFEKQYGDREGIEDAIVGKTQFEIRQLRLKEARLLLGEAIDRCRKLYEKYLEWSPENCYAWSKFAELERSLYETERARAVFELAIDQPALDIPELLWKAYIDFEISEGEFERTRALYERLLNRTKHLKVWISYAKFEASAMGGSDIKQKKKCLQHARDVFERAVSYLINSAPELKEERVILLEEWIYMENNFGELGDANLVRAKLPKKLKKRRQIETEDGPAAYEEYIDYLFPEQTTNMKLLDSAYKWKKQRVASKD